MDLAASRGLCLIAYDCAGSVLLDSLMSLTSLSHNINLLASFLHFHRVNHPGLERWRIRELRSF